MATEPLSRLKEQGAAASERFARQYAAAVRDLNRLSAAGARRIESLLRDLREDIVAQLTAATVSSAAPIELAALEDLAARVRESMTFLTREATAETTARLAEAFELGGGVTAGALSAATRVTFVSPFASPELLAALSGATGDIFDALSTQLGDRIIREIRRSALGLEPASAAIPRIADILRPVRGRRRIGVGFQAEAIVRTEVGRAYSVAQQASSEAIAETIPGLKKRWVTTLGKRRGHRDAERRYAEGGETGPIPVSARFEVTEFSRTGRTTFFTKRGIVVPAPDGISRIGRPITDRMSHPRDPSASAANVVQCTCIVMEVIPDLEQAGEMAAGMIT